MKPDAVEVVDEIFADLRDRRFLKWLFSEHPTLIGTFSDGEDLRSMDSDVQDEIAAAWQEIIRKALLTARNQGRDEGLEEAAAIAGADNRSELAKQQGHKPRWHQYGMAIAATIRAKIGEHENG